jgi:prepilin-type N-terminal cleavage/methylation domain-containing protein
MTNRIPVQQSERGFTLAELLVGMTLSLVALAGAFEVLQQAGRASAQAAATADVNQSIRIAMNVVIRDLIQAGEARQTVLARW